jgi:hypothetical protein
MGNATIQGQLWRVHAQDWVTYVEQVCLPLFGAALDAARVTSGTRLLDAGCGAGLLALLDSLRGCAGNLPRRFAWGAGNCAATFSRSRCARKRARGSDLR